MASHSATTYTVLTHIIISMDQAILVDQPMRENWLLQRRASLPRDEGDLQRLVGDLAFLSFSPQVGCDWLPVASSGNSAVDHSGSAWLVNSGVLRANQISLVRVRHWATTLESQNPRSLIDINCHSSVYCYHLSP